MWQAVVHTQQFAAPAGGPKHVLMHSDTISSPAVHRQGWVPIDVLAQHMRSKPSLEELLQVVTENDKVRALYSAMEAAASGPCPLSTGTC
jgi:hypothetical protein